MPPRLSPSLRRGSWQARTRPARAPRHSDRRPRTGPARPGEFQSCRRAPGKVLVTRPTLPSAPWRRNTARTRTQDGEGRRKTAEPRRPRRVAPGRRNSARSSDPGTWRMNTCRPNGVGCTAKRLFTGQSGFGLCGRSPGRHRRRPARSGRDPEPEHVRGRSAGPGSATALPAVWLARGWWHGGLAAGAGWTALAARGLPPRRRPTSRGSGCPGRSVRSGWASVGLDPPNLEKRGGPGSRRARMGNRRPRCPPSGARPGQGVPGRPG